jgi:hypothetical protein
LFLIFTSLKFVDRDKKAADFGGLFGDLFGDLAKLARGLLVFAKAIVAEPSAGRSVD